MESPLLIIRPIRMEDLDQLVELASMTSYGLTSLPKDRELLRKKIIRSQRSFEDMPDSPGAELYLFVMEEVTTGLVTGTCSILAKTGGYDPFWAYELKTEVFTSKMLNVRKEIQTLNLYTEHNGPCEIGSLFLRPSHRHSGNGRLLALSRFLFMANFPQMFEPVVIAEMRGVIDERGQSDFWDALGRHFFDIDFPDADYLVTVNKKFIAELMPRHSIYVTLLPLEAQAVIGKVHDRTRPALGMLEREGFEFANMVDIFEAGPTVRCELQNIRAVRESIACKVAAVTDTDAEPGGDYLISNANAAFRVTRTNINVGSAGHVTLAKNVAAALNVTAGDDVRYVAMRPATSD